MAQVDFSNAVITAVNLANVSYAALPSADVALNTRVFRKVDTDDQISNTSTSVSVYSESTSRKSFRYVGSFNTVPSSGSTSFRIGYAWKVSNVSYSAGDVFDFIVDVDTSVV